MLKRRGRRVEKEGTACLKGWEGVLKRVGGRVEKEETRVEKEGRAWRGGRVEKGGMGVLKRVGWCIRSWGGMRGSRCIWMNFSIIDYQERGFSLAPVDLQFQATNPARLSASAHLSSAGSRSRRCLEKR